MTCWERSSHSNLNPTMFVGLAPWKKEDKILLICHVTTRSKCHVTLQVGCPHPKLPPCYVWGP